MHRIISYIGYIVLLINVIVYFKASYVKKTSFKIFSYYLLTMFIIQITSSVMNRNGMDNLFLSHYYFILQFILLGAFYLQLYENDTLKKIVKLIISITLVIIGIQYIITPKIYFKFNLIEINLTSLILILFSTIYFTKSLKEKKQFLYVNSGIFIYLISSILIFSAGNLMKDLDQSVNRIIWSVNALLYLFFQILVFIEWYKNYRIKT